jgi:hypothetical protein
MRESESVARLLRLVFLSFSLALVFSAPALAGGGNYVFAGGTAPQQAQVRDALNASSFNWSLIPQQVTIHIAPGTGSMAIPGCIWIDADLLNSGKFAWGVIQHEYAHQLDFLVLDDTKRATLAQGLGGSAWWETGVVPAAHDQLTSERFASMVSWAFWQSSDNIMKPSSNDESGSMAPTAFRTLLAQVLGTRTLTSVKRVAAGHS